MVSLVEQFKYMLLMMAHRTLVDIEFPACFLNWLSDTTCLNVSGKPCSLITSRGVKNRFIGVKYLLLLEASKQLHRPFIAAE